MNNQNDPQEINRKRKNNNLHDQNNASNLSKFCTENIQRVGVEGEEEDDNDLLTLSLSFPPTNRPRIQSPPKDQPNLSPSSMPLPSSTCYLPPVIDLASPTPIVAGPLQPMRNRRNSSKAAKDGKGDTIPPPFPWATNCRATVQTFNYLLSKQIFIISGDVQCKRCERKYQMAFDLREKFLEIGTYIADNKVAMHDRAPDIWMNPLLPTCQFCKQENSVKPIISEEKSSINWLFLLLGKMLGCCTLDDLKYFCEHTKNHRTGAKDRVLYLTYLTLCKQLDPNGPFDRC